MVGRGDGAPRGRFRVDGICKYGSRSARAGRVPERLRGRPAKDWGAERVTDAAYGVSARYSLLRVDVTKRLFGDRRHFETCGRRRRGPVPVSPDPRAAGRALLFVGTRLVSLTHHQ